MGPIFVVGYSRSGTKFMCNLLESSTGGRVRHLGELHFFGRIALTGHEKINDLVEARRILKALSEQYSKRKNCPYPSADSILNLVEKNLVVGQSFNTKADILKIFLSAVSADLGSVCLCDGTPRNSYYLAEIFEIFPDAKVIYMLRDPRDCINSQKNKPIQAWMRGDRIEAMRLFFNYNPVLMARFWRSSLESLGKNISNENLMIIKYERLVSEPKEVLELLSKFMSIPAERLLAHHNEVKTGNSNKFLSGLSCGEIASIEYLLKKEIKENDYRLVAGDNCFHSLFVLLWLSRLIFVAPIVYMLNLGRFYKASHELKKRIFN